MHRAEYYDRLMAIRNEGNWEGWLKFFLRGVYTVSREATDTARAILALREQHRTWVSQLKNSGVTALRLLDALYEHPVITVRMTEQYLGCSYVTANKLIEQCVSHSLLREVTGGQRNRRFQYQPYIDLFIKQPLYVEGINDDRPITLMSE